MKCECGKEFEGRFCPNCGKPAQYNQQNNYNGMNGQGMPNQNYYNGMNGQGVPNPDYNNMNGQGMPNPDYNNMNGQGMPNPNYNNMNGQGIPNQNYYNGMNAQGMPNQNYYNGMNGQGNQTQIKNDIPNPLTGMRGLCFWGIMILAIIFAIVYFSDGEIVSGFCFLIAAFPLCPLVLNRLSAKRQRAIGFVTIIFILAGMFWAWASDDENGGSGRKTTQEGYLGDTITCDGWEIVVTDVSEDVHWVFGDSVYVYCDVSITNISSEDQIFYPDDIFVLNDAGIKDQVGISCDYYGKTISSGASFTDHFVFVLPESANKDLNNMTLEVGGLPIHLYRYN